MTMENKKVEKEQQREFQLNRGILYAVKKIKKVLPNHNTIAYPIYFSGDKEIDAPLPEEETGFIELLAEWNAVRIIIRSDSYENPEKLASRTFSLEILPLRFNPLYEYLEQAFNEGKGDSKLFEIPQRWSFSGMSIAQPEEDGTMQRIQKVEFENGILEYKDARHKFRKGKTGDAKPKKLFESLWKNQKIVQQGNIKQKGESHPAGYYAVNSGMANDVGAFDKNKTIQKQFSQLIKGIGRMLKLKGFPIKIENKGDIQLVITYR